MRGLLVRVGIDQAFGNWNAPVNAEGRFVYVPIPEKEGTEFRQFHPGLGRGFGEVIPALQLFCEISGCCLDDDLRFPKEQLLKLPMHLDPDFECLTYGNRDNTRGGLIRSLGEDDLLVFYAGLRPTYRCDEKLIYALIGMYVIREVVPIAEVPPDRWHENAHVRKKKQGENDVVVWGKPGVSGRFERCIPIGEWRDRAYRVQRPVLKEWGGLSVKDGFIHRGGVPSRFNDPEQFMAWLYARDVQFVRRNN